MSRTRLSCSICIQPLLERRSNQCGRYRRHWFVWNGVLSPKFVQSGCRATANHNPSRRDAAARRGGKAYKKEGPKFMQRLVAKQKARIEVSSGGEKESRRTRNKAE